jgi:hypothetical protein
MAIRQASNRAIKQASNQPTNQQKQVAGSVLLDTCFLLVARIVYSLTLEMEALCSSTVLVNFY